MKLLRTIAMFCALLCMATAQAQDNPVKWSTGVEHLGGADYRVTLTARIADGWHIYDLGPYEVGPNPTVVTFKAEGAAIEGEMKMLDKAHKYYDDIFMTEIGTFEKRARFAQNVRLTADKATIAIDVEWMACNDQSCMPTEDKTLTVAIESTPAAAELPANGSAAKEQPEQMKLPAIEKIAENASATEGTAGEPAAETAAADTHAEEPAAT
ncbi:MAG: thiol:disulfide interchange protein, partial [Alistipes sp.]|nr:thiol:disulfide interchange protein [Alistipes sp.]